MIFSSAYFLNVKMGLIFILMYPAALKVSNEVYLWLLDSLKFPVYSNMLTENKICFGNFNFSNFYFFSSYWIL